MKIQKSIIIIVDVRQHAGSQNGDPHSMLEAETTHSELMQTIAHEFTAPVKLNKLMGDTAIFFAPVDNGNESDVAKKIFHQAISAFRAFNKKNDQLGMDGLALKMFIHSGNIVEKQLLNKIELCGDELIIANRLLRKNSIQSHQYISMSDKYYQSIKNEFTQNLDMKLERVESFGLVSVAVLHND